MKLNKKGQALIEFVLILPIFLLILFAIVDFGRLFYEKIKLEDKFSESIKILEKENNYDRALLVLQEEASNQVTLQTEYYKSWMVVEAKLEFLFLTPGLNLILGNPYTIKIERTIPYEEETNPTFKN